jgi:hypothetical protein
MSETMSKTNLGSFEFTEMRDSEGHLGTKTVTRNADGTFDTSDYGNAARFHMVPRLMPTLEAMRDYLDDAAKKPFAFLVRAQPLPTLDISKPQLRRHARTDGTATLEPVERWWAALDLDDVPVPEGLGEAHSIKAAGLWVRENLLPDAFKGVRCILTPTTKTGLRGPMLARMRLWFLLDAPYSDTVLANWCKGFKAARGVPCDPRVFVSSQPIYTGRARFVGMDDPLAGQPLAVIIEGDKGDRVALDIGEFEPEFQRITSTFKAAAVSAGSDWKSFLQETVGSDMGFYEPLSKGLGIAARAGADDAEVVEFVAQLLKDRADIGRCRQYGTAWVLSTMRTFRAKDATSAAAAAAAVSLVRSLYRRKDPQT